MTVMIAAAFLTALVTALLVTPLVCNRRKKAALAATILVPFLSLGLYLWHGAPGIHSQPALFKKAGPRAMRRGLVREELAVMEKLSEDPQNTKLMLELGALRLRNGRLESAITILEKAQSMAPENEAIQTELGAAWYALGTARLLMEDTPQDALSALKKAHEIAPADAPYREKLKSDRAKLKTRFASPSAAGTPR